MASIQPSGLRLRRPTAPTGDAARPPGFFGGPGRALVWPRLLVYGVPYVAERTSYAWEAGRARADSEALAKLDKEGIVNRASLLFRMATHAVSPAVVNVQSFR